MTEAHVAGHSTHFLRRLDRVADQQVELALTLYRDPELLHEVLRRARLGDRVERVAISLDHDREGPFVVVTRDGKFVTCLGRGMRPTGLEVLTRAQLDAAAARVDRMRERLEQARRLEGELDRGLDRLVRKLTHAGPQLAREDFEALARWEPLLGRTFTDMTVRCNRFVLHARAHVTAIRPRRHSSAEEDLLEEFWYAFWARSHLIALSNSGDPRLHAEELRRDSGPSRVDPMYHLLVHPHVFGVTQHSMRALWATARHARHLLADTKAQATPSLVYRAMRDLTLGMIAHASSRSRAEATKALGIPDPGHSDGFERTWGELLRGRVLAPLAMGTEGAIADHRARLLAYLASWQPSLSDAEIDRLDVRSPDVQLSALASNPYSWVCNTDWISGIADAIPWLTRCDASQLFATRAFCEAVAMPYSVSNGLKLATGIRAAMGGGRPVTARRPAAPMRNDRCPCGSGAKYKRCCAASPVALARAA